MTRFFPCSLLGLIFLVALFSCGSDSESDSGVDTELFVGPGNNQPLIVGLGGSEGGNAWASSRWKAQRDKFITEGYAFLALGYFDAPGAPENLDRISLDKVHQAIKTAMEHLQISNQKVALIGGSKGAELALVLASHYPDISCVVSIVGSNAAFPALTFGASTSSWTYQGNEVPYVPATWSTVPSLLKGNLRKSFEIMMEDTTAVRKALIEVEKIQGPIFCLSATRDEMWPSKEMSDAMMSRLREKNFNFPYEHVSIEGGHTEPLKHFDKVMDFLAKNFPAK